MKYHNYLNIHTICKSRYSQLISLSIQLPQSFHNKSTNRFSKHICLYPAYLMIQQSMILAFWMFITLDLLSLAICHQILYQFVVAISPMSWMIMAVYFCMNPRHQSNLDQILQRKIQLTNIFENCLNYHSFSFNIFDLSKQDEMEHSNSRICFLFRQLFNFFE